MFVLFYNISMTKGITAGPAMRYLVCPVYYTVTSRISLLSLKRKLSFPESYCSFNSYVVKAVAKNNNELERNRVPRNICLQLLAVGIICLCMYARASHPLSILRLDIIKYYS
jgi:hypothetical protein